MIFKRTDNANFLPSELTQAQVEAASSPTSYEGYSNICPISGWSGCEIGRTGKNLLDPLINVESGYFIDGNGIVVTNAYMQYTADYIRVKPNTEYCISGNIFGNTLDVYNTVVFYTLSKAFISRFIPSAQGIPANFVTPSDCAYIRFNFTKEGDVTQIQVEEGSQPTTFESYTGTTIPITFHDSQGNPLTVYGGTLDVTSGVLTVDRAYKKFGQSDEWTKGNASSYCRFLYALPNGFTTSATYIDGLYCNILKPSLVADDYICKVLSDARLDVLLPLSLNITTADQMKNWAVNNGLEVVYKLAQTLPIQLDPATVTTLLGQNNIFADCGPSTVEYPCDTKLYVSNKMEEIENLRNTIAPIEDGDTASQLYGQGRYFFRNGSFCKAKTDILQNAQFTLNTNYEVTTVANELYDAINPFSV